MEPVHTAVNPCIQCGACCASFRVMFYWREAEKADHDCAVPAHLFEELSEVYRCMKGTNEKHRPCCAALGGRIGKNASCTIYENRPTPCRQFTASYADGKRQPRCDQARSRHGLRPLTPEDWK